MKRIWLLPGTILPVTLAGALWWFFATGTAVDVAMVERGPIVEAVYATGVIEPVNWAKVSPTVSGRVIEIAARDNALVRRGEVLARLDDAEARARLSESEARMSYWRDELARQRTLSERGVSSRESFDRSQAEFVAAQAAYVVASQRLSDLTLVAPMDGIVLRQDGEIGEVVDKLQTLFWIGQPRPLRALVEVDEEDIPLVAIGQKALVKADAFPDSSVDGKVAEITPKGDPQNKSYRVRVALPDDMPFHIGMTVETNVIVRQAPNALLVPIDAIHSGVVYVVEHGKASARTVRVGIRGREKIEIVDGLAPGEKVVINPPAGLQDGARVRVRERR